MKKYLVIKDSSDIMQYDTENNELLYPRKDVCGVYKLDLDMQIISNKEVINAKLGDILLVFNRWEEGEFETKVIVVSDPMVYYDLTEWINSSKYESR